MRIFVFFLISMCLFVQPAFAQSKKELAAQNVILAQRLSILENRMLTGDPAAERLMQRMDALEAGQRALTGEVERLRYERDGLQDEVRVLASDIANLLSLGEDMRLHLKAVSVVASRPTSQQPAPVGGSVYGGGRVGGGVYGNGSSIAGPPMIIDGAPTLITPALNVPVGNDMGKLAEIGREQMAEGNFSDAQTSFKQYLDLNPKAADRGDVYYWLGETHYVLSAYADAADAYIASMRANAKGSYAPDAMVRLAATARALGQTEMACQTLASFPVQYPNASSSVKSKASLEKQRSGC
ncbi:MAG: hypothetical protein COA43_11645 [Robiginitomaculum sp.]|nr:MAG: hypothetical protein COA43_11645 [Robiginitomaculum sp.]